MKKIFILIPVLLLTAIIYYGCEKQITEPESSLSQNGLRLEKITENLQDTDGNTVGTVNIWNDAEYLYVGIKLIEGSDLCIQSTAVNVAKTIGGLASESSLLIPAPNEEDCPTSAYYMVALTDLEITTCMEIYVAAGAVLKDPNTCSETFIIGSGTNSITTILDKRYGNESSFTQVNQPAGLAWVHPQWKSYISNYAPFGSANNWPARWIWEAGDLFLLTPDYYNSDQDFVSYTPGNLQYGSVLKMKTEFQICGEPSGPATFTIACDNGFEAWLNPENPISVGDETDGWLWEWGVNDIGSLWQSSSLRENFVNEPYNAWLTKQDISIAATQLKKGLNTLYLHVANENGPSGVDWNPGGVIFIITGPQTPEGNITASINTGSVEDPTPYINYSLPCPGNCQDEAGYAGDGSGSGSAWWYYFDGVGEQRIFAGQKEIAGAWVKLENGKLVIHLADWELMYVSEPVKVFAFGPSDIPEKRPNPGKSQIKDFVYKSDGDILVDVSSYPSSYYAIHLDIMLCP